MMSKRLQVIMGDDEFREIELAAAEESTTVSAWVRQALRRSRRATASGDVDAKLAALRAGMRHDFPTADVDSMLSDIERGYLG